MSKAARAIALPEVYGVEHLADADLVVRQYGSDPEQKELL